MAFSEYLNFIMQEFLVKCRMINFFFKSQFQFVRGGGGSGSSTAGGTSSMGNTGFCGSKHTSTVKPSDNQDLAMLCDICQAKFTLFNRKVSGRLMFKVSHQFIFRFSLFGQSDKKNPKKSAVLFIYFLLRK